MSEHWPSRQEPPAPALPRVEDLPLATDGYDRQKVREAFDAFYRHAAQLDAALRTLEAVEAFQRSAGELRGDLRAIRAAGFAAQTWQRPYGSEPRLRRALLPEAFSRVAAEVAFLIALAVALGVSNWSALPVIGIMALALVLVWAVEWLASRERPLRTTPRRAVARPAPPPADVAEEAEAPAAVGWAAFAGPGEDRADAMTMVEPLPRTEPVAALAAPEVEVEVEVEIEADVVEPTPDPAVPLVLEPESREEEAAADVQQVLEPEEEASADLEPAPEAASAIDAEESLGSSIPEEAVDTDESRESGEPVALDEDSVASETTRSESEPELEVAEEPAPFEQDLVQQDSPATETETELAQDPVAASEPPAEPEAAVEAEGSRTVEPAEPRQSLWRRMRGGTTEADAVILEPPGGHTPVLSEAEAAAHGEPGNAEPEQRIDEVGVVAPADEAEPERFDEVGVVEHDDEEEPAERRWFWQRRSAPETDAADSADLLESQPSADETGLGAGALDSEAAVDPWEQGLELPAEPELELLEAEDELELEPAPDESEPEPIVAADDEPPDQWESQEDGGPDGVGLAEDEPLARGQLEPEDEPALGVSAATPNVANGDPELVEEPEELAIEVLAEQAAAALERSRARRRHLRRARRR